MSPRQPTDGRPIRRRDSWPAVKQAMHDVLEAEEDHEYEQAKEKLREACRYWTRHQRQGEGE